MYIVLERTEVGTIVATPHDAAGTPSGDATIIELADLPAFVIAHESQRSRWAWDDTRAWYPALLRAGVRVERCVDLRLCHRILRHSQWCAESELASAPEGWWDGPDDVIDDFPDDTVLFKLESRERPELGENDPGLELRRQLEAVAGSGRERDLRLLLAGESAGGLIAAEIKFAGLPWSVATHDRILTELLGPRLASGAMPVHMVDLLGEVREALDNPEVNPDSQPDLLKALRRAGLDVSSTGQWELQEFNHPVIAPLRAYRKMSRLLSANGWRWLDEWITDGRFHPEYVVGGVVTGRWATSGGGALQLPHEIRAAVRADPGWKFVVADAAQLEPRILAGLSQDFAMAEAGRSGDLYEGMVDAGAVASRADAKIGMLGAMYGGTSGGSGQLMPRLRKSFPRAIAHVEEAARAGERGESVTTRLGRSSPLPSEEWFDAQRSAFGENGDVAQQNRARSQARSWGRFTRNFVVQGSAAEWALCWMASVRRRLAHNAEPLLESAHLAFFLHDEIIVHVPAEDAQWVATQIEEAAAEAGKLLFGDFPVSFPLTAAIVDNYAEAKD